MLKCSLFVQFRLLCVEHLEKKGKPLLYLVFEYMDTDLKKYIDVHARAQGQGKPPLVAKHVQVTLNIFSSSSSI